MALSWIYEFLGKINWSKGTSKNSKALSLSVKCAIALRDECKNIKSSFPLIASQEIRFYESSGFIIFQRRISVQQRAISCAVLTSKGHKLYRNNEPTVASLQQSYS